MGEQQNVGYLTPEFFSNLSDAIKSVFDITSRVDERVKIIMEKQSEVDRRIGSVMEHLNSLTSRVSVLESKDEKHLKSLVDKNTEKIETIEARVQILQIHHDAGEAKYGQMFNALVQIVLALTTAYLVYKLGLQPK